MKKSIKTILFSTLSISIILISACAKKTDSTNNNTTNNNNNTPISDNVTFKVNDTLCRTLPTTGGDVDEHIGVFTESVQQLSIDFWGDVPTGRPHRGNFHLMIKNFKFEPATYNLTSNSENYASFTRYETINAGGAKDYMAINDALYNGSSFTFTITEIAKDPNSMNGRDYLAKGTFVASLQNKVFTQLERDRSKQTVLITDGSFSKIRIAGGPL